MKLKTGDRIYQYQTTYAKRLEKRVITSTGVSRAYSGSLEFEIDVGTSGAVVPCKNDPIWWIETDQLRDEYDRQILLNEWDKVNWSRVSTRKIRKIIEILEC